MIDFILIFSILSLFMIISILIHEYSHALTAKLFGWKTHGMTIIWKKGAIGYKIEINKDKPEDLWKIAAGGLIGTIVLIFTSIGLAIIWPTLMALAYINLALALINIIPFWGSDGSYIFKRIKECFQRPSG